MAFEPNKVYESARHVYSDAKDYVSERKRVLTDLYNGAVRELGYNDDDLKNNEDKMHQVVQLMFSDKYAGNKEKNALLKDSPFYAGWAKANSTDRQKMHSDVIGMNNTKLLELVNVPDGHTLNSQVFGNAINHVNESYIDNCLKSHLSLQIGSGIKERKANYAALVPYALDASGSNIKVAPDMIDTPQLEHMAIQAIRGKYSREDLEDRVGVEFKKVA